MGRYILIEFDNDDSAERLCAQINTATEAGKPFRIAGIFQRPPAKRCECGSLRVPTQSRSRLDNGVRRHKKTGFYYCTRCKRVLKGWQSPRNFLDNPDLPADFFSKGMEKEASLHLTQDGKPVKNYSMTTRTTPHGEPLAPDAQTKKRRK